MTISPSRLGLVSLACVLTALCSLSAYFLLGLPAQGIDDADITLTYARNLAAGYGYVYTPGGERVEGSTSLLWTLACAALSAIFRQPELAAGVLGVLFTGLAVGATLLAAHRLGGWVSAGLAAGGLIAAPLLFAWSATTLMDSALWTLALVAASVCAVLPVSRAWLAAACVAVVLSRPEGFLYGPLLAFLGTACAWLSGAGARASLRRGLPALALSLAAMASSTLWRVFYFGHPLPNTYYAKVGDDRLHTIIAGLKYDWHFVRDTPLLWLILVAFAVAAARDLPALFRRLRGGAPLDLGTAARLGLGVVVASGFAIRLLEGGDHFFGHRALQPFVPLAVLVAASLDGSWAAELIARASPRGNTPASVLRAAGHGALGVALAAVALVAWGRFARHNHELAHDFKLATMGRQMAGELVTHFGHPLPSVGVMAAGGIGYAYPGRVQDLLGLNWSQMAHASRDRKGPIGHAAFSRDVFWSDPPAVVHPILRRAAPADACGHCVAADDLMLQGLLTSERFRAGYVVVVLEVRGGLMSTYVRRDWLAKHPLAGARVVDWPVDAKTAPHCRVCRLPGPAGV